ncbi:flagellar biosynthetic protein FliR [Quadrisphaera granulorum]|uniref:Flagellar biosynthetic protein FliR n=1 Tax=Quadrisphaera granulorum TaxID=317664 RepID=A0A316AR54_9ACTN|nr:flagellar biosynthetic protein FliR [Quadrisphaera granulorum]PWJ52577.1 flagellar biosynthetic protein FliR [Quadrisphaera granulorum]SZE97627.1 flagellar biosynthetic protein FliR [Quadrisphaera granulorum]
MTMPDVSMQIIVGYLLVMLRITAWLVIAPPFAHRAIPARVKALIGFALTLAVGGTQDFSTLSLDTDALVSSAVWQVLIGAALGFVCYLVFAAVQTAGNLIDLFGGFQLTQAFDPQMQSGAAVFGRTYQLIAMTLLFASNGHLILLHGITSSFRVLGLSEPLSLEVLSRVVTDGTGQVVVAALQIAGPLIAILFLTDVGLGLLTRAAPSLQAFSLGFPLKVFVTLSVAALAVAMLPSISRSLTESAATQQQQVLSASATAATSEGGEP